ncbi:hypothetical protein CYY_005532 [Polysphondylium violaceum]|uniref:Uncharacterized protein n=1 Tax=Polysphondylium violaceum TaxID=133409 RepID=A0A8J4PRP8_9MYCE|nr:hypothetical protein CYY_005532 [Polysphondylium violaceum]
MLNQLFYQLWRDRYIRVHIFNINRYNSHKSITIDLAFLLKGDTESSYQLLKNFVRDGLKITLEVQTNDDIIGFMYHLSRFKYLIHEIDFKRSSRLFVPDGFILDGVEKVVFPYEFSTQNLTRTLVSSSVKILDLGHCYSDITLAVDSLHPGLEELYAKTIASKIEYGTLPLSLRKLVISDYKHPLENGVLPDKLVHLKITNLVMGCSQDLVLPTTLRYLESSNLDLIDCCPSFVTQLHYTGVKPMTGKFLNSPPLSLTKMTYQTSVPLHEFSCHHLLLNLVSLEIMFDGQPPINLKKGDLQLPSLESLKLLSFHGNIQQDAIPISVQDLFLSFSNNQKILEECCLPSFNLSTLFINFSTITEKLPPKLFPNSLQSLKIESMSKKIMANNNLPQFLTKLEIYYSALPRKLIIPNTITSIVYLLCEVGNLSQNHFPVSLRSLEIESTPYFYNCIKLKNSLMEKLVNLAHLKLTPMRYEPNLRYPPNLSKLDVSFFLDEFKLDSNSIPQSVTQLKLAFLTSYQTISLDGIIPNSVRKLSLYGASCTNFDKDGLLPKNLQYLDFGVKCRDIYSLLFLPNSLLCIYNLPIIQTSSDTIDNQNLNNLSILHTSKRNYSHNFIDKHLKLPQYVKILNIK